VDEVDDLVLVVLGQEIHRGGLREGEIVPFGVHEIGRDADERGGARRGRVAVELEVEAPADGDRQHVPVEVEAEDRLGPVAGGVAGTHALVLELAVAETAVLVELVATGSAAGREGERAERHGGSHAPHGSMTSTLNLGGATRPSSSCTSSSVVPT